jgi:microcin C transport system substrate-binding protein
MSAAPPAPRPAGRLALLGAVLLALPLAAAFPPYDGTAERDAFWDFYNRKVLTQLQTQLKDLPGQIAKATAPEEKAALEAELAKTRARLQKPEFFTFATPAEVPADLAWENGLAEPEIGDPQAQKGGTMRQYILSFPPTLRILGENANSSFRGYHYDEVEMGLISLHPETGKMIPSIAREWAVAADNRTVFFRLDPDARWSNGDPIESDDFFLQFYMQLSEYPKNPFGNEWYASQYTNITRYDARTLSITLAEPKLLAPYWASLSPLNRRFYAEFGPDFEQRYQWRCRPTAGAYEIREDDIHFGRSVTLSRVKDWWARDKKFYRHRYNVDRIVYRVVRLQEKVLESRSTGTKSSRSPRSTRATSTRRSTTTSGQARRPVSG